MLSLPLAKQAVVDEDTGELLTDRTLHECGRDGRVDTTRKTTDGHAIADLLANESHLFVDDVRHGPRGSTTSDLEQEVLEYCLPML